MAPSILFPPERINLMNKLNKEYQVNVKANDMISLHRSLHERIRDPDFGPNIKYPKVFF